jgi:hypothetical protein
MKNLELSLMTTDYHRTHPLFSGAVSIEGTSQFAKNPWTHGLEPNRFGLKKFVQYAREQRYISFEPAVDDLFAAME